MTAWPPLPVVSIRSPHQSKGRPPWPQRRAVRPSFQSAPLTKARGDLFRARDSGDIDTFQSAPLTKARGDAHCRGETLLRLLVSIRSPHQSKGRRDSVRGALPEDAQVSIRSPHQSKGRRLGPPPPHPIGTGFNPLPSPKQGETHQVRKLRRRGRVSIRSPHQSKGETSIMTAPAMAHHLFQSAPLTKARGDSVKIAASTSSSSFNPLPSPKQGETQAVSSQPHLSASFNPLPSPKQGETYVRALPIVGPLLFQSAPLTKARGDAILGISRRPSALVSIRSPHQSKGRRDKNPYLCICPTRFNPLPSPKQGETLSETTRTFCGSRFQSAPLTKARGDQSCPGLTSAMSLFQSAPLTKARGDSRRTCRPINSA